MQTRQLNFSQLLEKARKADLNDTEIEQLAKSINYFEKAPELNSVHQAIQKMQKEWTAQKDAQEKEKKELSQEVKHNLLAPLAEQLYLTADSTFNLLDAFFVANPNRLLYILECESRRTKIQQERANLPPNYPANNHLEQQYNMFSNEIRDSCQKIVKIMHEFYFNQRLFSLQSTQSLVLSRLVKSQEPKSKELTTKLLQKGLCSNLIDSLVRNLSFQEEMREMLKDENVEVYLEKIQEQQLLLIKTLFILFFNHQTDIKPQEQAKYLAYLKQVNFSGQCCVDARRYQPTLNTVLAQQQEDIKTYAIFTGMACTGLKPMSQLNAGFECKVDEQDLNQVSILVYLPILVKQNLDQQLYNKVRQIPLLEGVQEMLRAIEKMTDLTFKPSFMELLLRWNDMLYVQESKQRDMDENFVEKLQQISLYLLKEPKIIKAFWQDRKSLKMYANFFQNAGQNFQQIMGLLQVLCGSQKRGFANDVYIFLQENMNQLLLQMFSFIENMHNAIQVNQASIQDYESYINAVVIFCKIIKQDRFKYKNINEIFKRQQLQSQNQNELSQINVGYEPQTRDFISLLTDSIMIQLNYCPDFDRCVSLCIDAMTSIFKSGSQNYRQLVISELSRNTFQENSREVPSVLLFVQKFYQLNYEQQMEHRWATSLFKLINAIYSQPIPYDCLSDNEQIRLDQSFLADCLRYCYLPLLRNYEIFKYTTPKSLLIFSYNLQKLTLTLLKYFVQVSDNGQKLLLSQAQPRFDLLLEQISQALNHANVYNIPIRLLQLRSDTGHFENTLICQVLQQFNNEIAPPQIIVSNSQKLVQKMLQILNILVQLYHQSDKSNDEKCSRQSFYVQKLLCVQEFSEKVKNLEYYPTQEGRLLDLCQIICVYISSQTPLFNTSIISVEAINFLTNAMRISKFNLFQSLNNVHGHSLKHILVGSLTKQLDKNELLPETLDFWITACQKQPQLVENVWVTNTTNFIKYIKNKPDDLCKYKLCVLFSIMSEKSLHLNMLKHENYELLHICFEHIIESKLKNLKQSKQWTGQLFGQDNKVGVERDEVEIQNIKVCTYYFCKLVQNEFNRSPQSTRLRQIIWKLYSIDSFIRLGGQRGSEKGFTELLQRVNQINRQELKTESMRDIGMFQQRQGYIRALPEYCQRFQYSQHQQMSVDSVLQTPDGSVYINDVDNEHLYKALTKTEPYELMSSNNYFQSTPGSLGTSFAIDIQDFEQTMTKDNYHNSFIAQTSALFKEYNLALSSLWVDSLLLKAKNELYTGIGQTQMREVRTKVQPDQLVTYSMIPFVSLQTDYSQMENDLTQSKQNLVSLSRMTVESLQQILLEQRDFKNALFDEYLSQLVQTMIVHLGALGHIAKPQKNANDPYQLSQLLKQIMIKLPDLMCKATEHQTQQAQITLLVFQLMSQLNENACGSQPILKALNQTVQSFRQGNCQIETLQILKLACDLTNQQDFIQFMHKQDSSVLKLVMSKLSSSRATVQEQLHCLSLFLTYSSQYEGALHLYQLNVLSQFTEVVKQINSQEFYVNKENMQMRNQTHMVYLQVLLLVRQMNQQLIEEPRTQHKDYFKQACGFIWQIQSRFTKIFSFCVNKDLRTGGSVVTLAMLEEIELLTSLFTQLMEHADLFAELTVDTYRNTKDCLLFAVPHLISNFKQLRPTSITEDELNNMSQQKSALNFKAQMHLSNTLMNTLASLQNILTIQRETDVCLVHTWDDYLNHSDQNTIYSLFLSDFEGCKIQYAYKLLFGAQDTVKQWLHEVNGEQEIYKKLLTSTSELFLYNSSVQIEYPAGLAATFCEEDFDEVIDTYEVSLGMGLCVLTLMLEQVRTQTRQYSGHQSIRNSTIFQNQTQSHYINTHLEQSHVANLAQQLLDHIKQLARCVNWKNPQKSPWGSNAEKYVEILQKYTAEVLKSPSIDYYYQ